MKTILRTLLLLSLVISHTAAPVHAQATTKTFLPTVSFSRPFRYYASASHSARTPEWRIASLMYQNISDYPIANFTLMASIHSPDGDETQLLPGVFTVTLPGRLNYFSVGYRCHECSVDFYYAGWSMENIPPTVPLSMTLDAAIGIRNSTDKPVHNIRYVFITDEAPAMPWTPKDSTLLPGDVTYEPLIGCGYYWSCGNSIMAAQGEQ